MSRIFYSKQPCKRRAKRGYQTEKRQKAWTVVMVNQMMTKRCWTAGGWREETPGRGSRVPYCGGGSHTCLHSHHSSYIYMACKENGTNQANKRMKWDLGQSFADAAVVLSVREFLQFPDQPAWDRGLQADKERRGKEDKIKEERTEKLATSHMFTSAIYLSFNLLHPSKKKKKLHKPTLGNTVQNSKSKKRKKWGY